MRRIMLLLLTILVGGVSSLCADEVFLTNGDRLSGTITQLVNGKLTIATTLAGDITVDVTSVGTLSTAAPVVMRFRDGTTVTGLAQDADAGQIRLADADGQVLRILALADVVTLHPPQPPTVWSGNARAGLTLTRGNSETEAANLGLGLQRRTQRDRTTFEGEYLFGRQEDPDTGERSTTEDRWFGALKYDYFLTKKLYLYGALRVEQDQVADLDLRLIVGSGLGYQWFERPDFHLFTEAGVSWLREEFDGGETNNIASLRVAYHVDKHFNKRIMIFHDVEAYPAFDDVSDVFLTAQAGTRVSLTKAMFLEAKVGVTHDTTPAEDAEKTDFATILSAGVTF
jgi:putative salt-induced outer membrane protein YdiY